MPSSAAEAETGAHKRGATAAALPPPESRRSRTVDPEARERRVGRLRLETLAASPPTSTVAGPGLRQGRTLVAKLLTTVVPESANGDEATSAAREVGISEDRPSLQTWWSTRSR